VSQALALFTFARDYAYRRPDVDQRIERFAERLVAAVRAGGVDEVLVVGHSIGAALAADALARALVLDPVTLVRIAEGETGKPQIRRVHLREMLTAATFQRHRWDFMRLHYQFIMANERRTMYDYFMLVCGPLAFAKSLGAPQGPAELFAPDGSCLAMAGIGGVRPSGQGAPLQT
jgi:pimeloyl-ACP methyl ester carboxylesterase